MRDRWYLNVQLTRRKNQVQQLLRVTHPDLNKALKKLGTSSVMKLVLEYPAGLHMKKSSEDEVYKVISKAGAKNVAKRAAKKLCEIMPYTVAVPVEHLVGRKKWIIEEALQLEESIPLIDMEIHSLLREDREKELNHIHTQSYCFLFLL